MNHRDRGQFTRDKKRPRSTAGIVYLDARAVNAEHREQMQRAESALQKHPGRDLVEVAVLEGISLAILTHFARKIK